MNFNHDFNNPNLWGYSTDVDHQVGDIVRAVDMDPSAGWALAKIFQTSGTLFNRETGITKVTFEAHIIHGTFRPWEPMMVKDV